MIITYLLDAVYITEKREERLNHYHINSDLPSLHPSHGETAIGDLLLALGLLLR